MRLKVPLLLLGFTPLAWPQGDGLPAKETLHYTIEWRLITAGKARLEWSSAGRSGWRLGMHIESVGLVSKLFRVEDDYSASLSEGLCAESVAITSREGNRNRQTRIAFDAGSRKASYLERDTAKNSVVLNKEIDIPPCVHDVLGGLYFLRTLNLEPGQSTELAVSDGKKSVMAKVEAQQREDVRTPSRTYKTIRYEAYLFNDVLYHRPAHLNVWLTDDRLRLPVQIRVRMQFTIGTITLQLEKRE